MSPVGGGEPPQGHGDAEVLEAELVQIAKDARRTFDVVLAQSLGHQRTAGTCLYAAVLCSLLINRFTAGRASVRGGDGQGDGGLFVDGTGHGHYWVEVETGADSLVVDITGDQFGLPPVTVAPLSALPAKYLPGNQSLVDGHAAQLLMDIEAEQRG